MDHIKIVTVNQYTINWLVFITETGCLLRCTEWIFKYNSGFPFLKVNKCIDYNNIAKMMY